MRALAHTHLFFLSGLGQGFEGLSVCDLPLSRQRMVICANSLFLWTQPKKYLPPPPHALQAFVYTFGFVLMTPQLYINYKLKSVAHLPWRFLCYRSLNTVIDDLFAFVIRMPAMHRLVR